MVIYLIDFLILLRVTIILNNYRNYIYKIILILQAFLIGLKVCFHSAMKHENDVSNMVDCLQVVRSYSFMKEIKVHIRLRI